VSFVLPLGELADLSAIDAEAAARGDDARLKAISANYDGADVLVARAAPKAGGTPGLTVTATRYSPGTEGAAQTWTNTYAGAPGEGEGDLMARAAAGTAAQVEEAWKRANILDPSQTGTLVVTVPASDLQSWIAVRDQLSGVPAIQGSDLIALDRQGARLALHYVGDPSQLRLALAQRDLELSGNAPDWVLRRRDAAGPH
jgi:hypothetical protein